MIMRCPLSKTRTLRNITWTAKMKITNPQCTLKARPQTSFQSTSQTRTRSMTSGEDGNKPAGKFGQPRLYSHQNRTKVRIQGRHGLKSEKYVDIERSIHEQHKHEQRKSYILKTRERHKIQERIEKYREEKIQREIELLEEAKRLEQEERHRERVREERRKRYLDKQRKKLEDYLREKEKQK
mmetsp:Transcript_22322/g.25642  ORF Transcript_22322/g.25642 Transcript_22322/m.25642 type:complete len:182 (+) Transcript_22322:159-704(+)